MKRTAPLALACTLLVSACTNAPPTPPPLDHGWAPPGACSFVGNRADRHYCATTGTQLLANPAVYDGQRVRVGGWVGASPDGKQLVMFLTRDALDTVSFQGTVVLRGSARDRIVAFVRRASPDGGSVPIQVEGRFRLHGLASDGSRAKQQGGESWRFGAIEEIDDYMP